MARRIDAQRQRAAGRGLVLRWRDAAQPMERYERLIAAMGRPSQGDNLGSAMEGHGHWSCQLPRSEPFKALDLLRIFGCKWVCIE